MPNKPNVIVIVGPTAVGKTKFSVDIAKKFNCEIISADSMQIYKYMNIGTAKVKPDEMEGIKHYLIDEIEPDKNFSVADYKEIAQKYLDKIITDGKIPLIVGGTGLYVNSLIHNINFSEVIQDEDYRHHLLSISQQKGNEYLHNMLKEIDPESANRLHPNDIKRVARALEVYKCTGNTITYYQSISKLEDSKFNFIIIGLTMDRKILYDRINKRVDLMVESGLIDEVRNLLKMGYNSQMISMQGIGYKEIINYICGKCSQDEAIEIIKRESRRYAKRQFTWFKRNDNIRWFDVTNQHHENIKKNIQEYIAQKMEIL